MHIIQQLLHLSGWRNIMQVSRPALKYYGGKWNLANWIVDFFPHHNCYVEPFGGAASVLLQKPLSPHEFYNDLDSDVVNFFRVLRENQSELIQKIDLTPYSREEYELSYEPTIDPIEKARRFYVRSWQSHNPSRLSGWRNSCNSNRSQSFAQDWNSINHLYAIAQRLKQVQIENRPALELIKRVDTKETLFYIDPPYLNETRTSSTLYAFELKKEDHIELAECLNSIKGMVIVSGYEHPLYNELYAGWTKKQVATKKNGGANSIEVLWISPNIQLQQTLFDFIN